MIKKTIEFEDLDGNKVTRDFWFNLNKAELAKLEIETPGGYGKYLQDIINSNETSKIIGLFDTILGKAYGIRGEDNITFHKKPEFWENFKNTDAYSVLFFELISNPEEAGKFVTMIVPAEFRGDMAATIAGTPTPKEMSERIETIKSRVLEGEVVEKDPLAGMTPAEIAALKARLNSE